MDILGRFYPGKKIVAYTFVLSLDLVYYFFIIYFFFL